MTPFFVGMARIARRSISPSSGENCEIWQRQGRRTVMSMEYCRRAALTVAAITLGVIVRGTPAIAASDNNPHTYSGDYQGGSLPIGTAVVSQYLGYAHSNTFVDPTGQTLPNSHANTWYEVTRVSYFAEFANRPLVIEADLPFATLTNVNIPGTNNAVAGGLVDPVVHL